MHIIRTRFDRLLQDSDNGLSYLESFVAWVLSSFVEKKTYFSLRIRNSNILEPMCFIPTAERWKSPSSKCFQKDYWRLW